MKLKILLLFLFIQFLHISLYNEENQKYIDKNKKVIGKQIFIKAGTYFVGNDKEKDNNPLREMFFKDFYIDIHPVTNGQYIDFLEKSNYKPKGAFSIKKAEQNRSYPATELVYEDVEAYAKFLKKRLATEWEWEIAARSLKKNVKYVSINLDHRKRGHFYSNKIHSTMPVFSYPPNDLGIYGMAGNVYEWTSSMYEKKYLFGKYFKKYRVMVLRGGAWTNNSSDIRTTTRTPFPSTRYLRWLGFRCVSDPADHQKKMSSPDNK